MAATTYLVTIAAHMKGKIYSYTHLTLLIR
jgi:hypothetical protein